MSLTREQVIEYDREYNQHPWLPGCTESIPVQRGEGIYFWDYNGKRYTDMCSQMGNVNLGYGNPYLIHAIQEQVAVLPYVSTARGSGPRSELAAKLVHLAPDNMGRVFFTTGGSDANEAAIAIARTYTGRQKILSMYRSYHGSTLGSGNVSGDVRRFALEKPAAPGFLKFFNPHTYHSRLSFDSEREQTAYFLDLLEQQILFEGPAEIAAVEVESVVGANGVLIPPEGYLQGLRDLTSKYGILLICDEVMAGFYRTGTLFAFQNWGIAPDIIAFAKGITCGYVPLGGVIFSREIAGIYDTQPFQYGLTYSGHTLGCAAGLAALEAYEKMGIEAHVRSVAPVLAEGLDGLEAKHRSVGQVRHIGLFAAVELVRDKDKHTPLVPYGSDPDGLMPKIHSLLLERGFAAMGRENHITIAPPLIITADQIKEELEKLDEVLSIVDKWSVIT